MVATPEAGRDELAAMGRAQVDMPDGLAVAGDSACVFNPVFGQGVTVRPHITSMR